jgi:SAM-dependent methyltransferase
VSDVSERLGVSSHSLYKWVKAAKPEPFSIYSARELWTDEHTSRRMLDYHLDGEVDISSRRERFIDESVSWMTDHFALGEGSRIIDFGCGPGLYTSRFAKLGAKVVGVDFSSRSIAFAREQAARADYRVEYINADYLEYESGETFDLITMIMCDYCALAPTQRSTMLAKFRNLLSAQGRIVLDVYSLQAFDAREEGTLFEQNLMDGFWSPDPYFGFVSSFKYHADKVSLDRYTIVEPLRTREIFNWLQYFSPESLEREVAAAGIEIETLLGDVAGKSYAATDSEFAVVMKAA